MSAAEESGRDHHAKGESWLGEHLGTHSFVGEAIADCLESAAIVRFGSAFPQQLLREWV